MRSADKVEIELADKVVDDILAVIVADPALSVILPALVYEIGI